MRITLSWTMIVALIAVVVAGYYSDKCLPFEIFSVDGEPMNALVTHCSKFPAQCCQGKYISSGCVHPKSVHETLKGPMSPVRCASSIP